MDSQGHLKYNLCQFTAVRQYTSEGGRYDIMPVIHATSHNKCDSCKKVSFGLIYAASDCLRSHSKGCQDCSVMVPVMPDPGRLSGCWPGILEIPGILVLCGFLLFPGFLVTTGFLAIPGIPVVGLGKLWSPEPGPGHWREFIAVLGGQVPCSKVPGSKYLEV